MPREHERPRRVLRRRLLRLYFFAGIEIGVDGEDAVFVGYRDSYGVGIDAIFHVTIVGPIKYDKEFLGLHYGDTVIAGGQWQMQEDGTEKLVVIDNTLYDMIAIEGEYIDVNATKKQGYIKSHPILDEVLAKLPGWSNIILGAIAILVIIFLPDGIMGTLQKKFHFEIFSQKRFSEPKRAAKKAKA